MASHPFTLDNWISTDIKLFTFYFAIHWNQTENKSKNKYHDEPIFWLSGRPLISSWRFMIY
jgi:hypothetical protein